MRRLLISSGKADSGLIKTAGGWAISLPCQRYRLCWVMSRWTITTLFARLIKLRQARVCLPFRVPVLLFFHLLKE